MANHKSNEILENFNGLGIFTRDNYTFVEYVDQLMKFQEETAKLVASQVLQQAAAAILAQANQQTSLVLTLLA